ncbi:MAG: glycosyltransferase family 4 protein [Burkholderiales bacterium]
MSTPPPKRLRIAVLNRNFKPTGGGAERYSIALVEQLAQRHEIHVFAQQIEHRWPGVCYHPIPLPFTKPRWINQVWFAFATWWQTRRGFDVVHSHENTWHGQVQTVHVVPVTYSLLQGRKGWRLGVRWLKIVTSPRLLAYLALERARYNVADGRCVVLASSTLKPLMASSFPLSVAACEVVTPGVAAVPGRSSPAERLVARTQLGLPVQGRCVLFVGNDFRKKGLPTLIQALAHLPEDVFVAVVGNAAQKALVQHELDASGQTVRIFFLGALSAVDVAYQAADCLAHPTLEDTFAMVVLEAMAHGLPVVVSSATYCGISALLNADVDALLLNDPRDSAELQGALVRVLDGGTQTECLRMQGLRFARQHLWSEIALQQEAIYNAVAL